MPKFEFKKTSVLKTSVDETFQWHERDGAFNRFMPPWQEARIVKPGNIQNGSEIITEVKIGPVWQTWIARMYGYQKNKVFCDEQLKGPFKSWHHQHLFSSEGRGCRMTDSIEYELPLGILGSFFGGNFAAASLGRLFEFRHRVLENDLEMYTKYKSQPRTILVTGASGLVGSHLIPFLTTQGHRVVRVVRSREGVDENSIYYDPHSQKFQGLEKFQLDSVIHLAGERISSGRWTPEVKKRIYDSRIQMTKSLSEALSQLSRKPTSLISASAVGFYGDRQDEELSEKSKVGSGFLSEVCRDWELATGAAMKAGIRVVNLRVGIVLSPQGGALQKMLPAFRMGLGGSLGSGEQWMSWISLDDLLYLILHCVSTEQVSGPVNAVSDSIRNLDFTRTLAHTIHRIMGPKAPAFVLRTFAGEMADALLLASTRVIPHRAKESGFEFRFSTLNSALQHNLGI